MFIIDIALDVICISSNDGHHLEHLGTINVIMGKNGCGKSKLLRAISNIQDSKYSVMYIPPERGGVVKESHVASNQRELENRRRGNQLHNFR